VETESKREVRKDRSNGERRDDRGLAVPRTRRLLLGLVHYQRPHCEHALGGFRAPTLHSIIDSV
jgi:hypothetical protein